MPLNFHERMNTIARCINFVAGITCIGAATFYGSKDHLITAFITTALGLSNLWLATPLYDQWHERKMATLNHIKSKPTDAT